ncbi:hypothetical protein [Sandarakinorhabdus cyanobacteriorum]|uniref:hypothetical protein n=1 Tax=Sandarakinorhabdus cyanobacteriorum TaxID=1981098 RepID=UPI0013FD22E4|nr:hypothetical protein [Sandarakinorhabdus cyanobacteriorum]
MTLDKIDGFAAGAIRFERVFDRNGEGQTKRIAMRLAIRSAQGGAAEPMLFTLPIKRHDPQFWGEKQEDIDEQTDHTH